MTHERVLPKRNKIYHRFVDEREDWGVEITGLWTNGKIGDIVSNIHRFGNRRKDHWHNFNVTSSRVIHRFDEKGNNHRFVCSFAGALLRIH